MGVRIEGQRWKSIHFGLNLSALNACPLKKVELPKRTSKMGRGWYKLN